MLHSFCGTRVVKKLYMIFFIFFFLIIILFVLFLITHIISQRIVKRNRLNQVRNNTSEHTAEKL